MMQTNNIRIHNMQEQQPTDLLTKKRFFHSYFLNSFSFSSKWLSQMLLYKTEVNFPGEKVNNCLGSKKIDDSLNTK